MPTDYFEARERALLGARYDEVYAAPRTQAERGATVSPLRATPAQFSAQIDFALEPSPFCAQSFRVLEEDFKPGRHPYHHAGVFYSQEPSAACAAPLLGVQSGMRVLDLCAAPGGKSSQLAGALGGKGLLVSNEYVAARADILKSNLERMGVRNAVVLNETPARIAAAFPQFFDRIMVDAPCSGEGMFRKEAHALVQHSEALVQQCAALGAEILNAAAEALASGGILVYATCTFAPDEDEAQIGRFLANHPDFTLCDAMQDCAMPFGSAGEANRTGEYPFDAAKTRRIWPCHGGEGHFIAKLQKAGTPREIDASGQAPAQEAAWLAALCESKGEGKGGKAGRTPAEAARRTGGQSAQKRTKDAPMRTRAAVDGRSLWSAFATETFPTLAAQPVALLGENILLPAPMPQAKLRVLRAGVFAGNVAKGRFIPEHHLFTAYGQFCANVEHLTLADARTAAYLRGDEIEAKTAAKGWCCVMVDGYPLGGGKVSAGRVKNHYPKALRNLK